jgi:hypothetical protein
MSARVDSPPIHGGIAGSVIIAIVAALAIGVFAGSLITRVTVDQGTAERPSVAVAGWDAGKLEAMQGRQLAEQFRTTSSVIGWDAGKLEAMQGRMLAEEFRTTSSVAGWDAGKLEAMQGRMLAEEFLSGTGS